MYQTASNVPFHLDSNYCNKHTYLASH